VILTSSVWIWTTTSNPSPIRNERPNPSGHLVYINDRFLTYQHYYIPQPRPIHFLVIYNWEKKKYLGNIGGGLRCHGYSYGASQTCIDSPNPCIHIMSSTLITPTMSLTNTKLLKVSIQEEVYGAESIINIL